MCVAVLEQIQRDAGAALKAGDRERTGALRMLASELQKAAKEAREQEVDEIAVLQRERKRRLESAEAYRDAGRDAEVAIGQSVVEEVSDLVRQGLEIAPGTIEAIRGALAQHESPRGILEDVVWSHRGMRVAPKTLNQKRYLDSIRNSTITVGI